MKYILDNRSYGVFFDSFIYSSNAAIKLKVTSLSVVDMIKHNVVVQLL